MKISKTLTLEEIEVTSVFDALLLAACSTKEQENQMLEVIQKRKKQKEKLCAQSVTKDT